MIIGHLMSSILVVEIKTLVVRSTDGYSDASTVISEVIIIFTLLSISPDLGNDLLVLNQQSGQATIQIGFNLGLSQLSRIAVELQSVDDSGQRNSGSEILVAAEVGSSISSGTQFVIDSSSLSFPKSHLVEDAVRMGACGWMLGIVELAPCGEGDLTTVLLVERSLRALDGTRWDDIVGQRLKSAHNLFAVST